MKIGISLDRFANKHGRYNENKFNKVRSHGFEAVDYSMQNTDTIIYTCSNDELKQLMQIEKTSAQNAGVVISQVHGPWRYPPKDDTVEDRQERLEKMKRAIIATHLLGCEYIVIHPIMPYGTFDLQSGNENATFKENLLFFTELGNFAKNYNVTICLENMPMLNFSLATPEKVLSLVKEIGLENVKICIDTGHINVFNNLDIAKEIIRVGSYLKVLHIHDNLKDKDTHLFPTQGTIDWQLVTSALKTIGYSGVFSLECPPAVTLNDSEFESESIRLYNIAKQLILESN